MRTNGDGNTGKASTATATAIISEPKILDLNSILSKSNGSSFSGPPRNNINVPTFVSRSIPLSTARLLPVKIENPEIKPSSNNHRLNSIVQKASTSNEVIQCKFDNHQVDLKKIPWEDRLCFNGSYIFYKEPQTTREHGEFDVQFKCTLPGCEKRLSTNINFVYHIWSHAKNLDMKESTSDVSFHSLIYGLGDIYNQTLERSSFQCIECLAGFTTSQKLQKHIFYVHRFETKSIPDHPVCRICEKEVDISHAERHADKHGEYELPFACPVCGCRSSNRHSLLFHFERSHSASTTLICPFCLEIYAAKRSSTIKSKRTILTSTAFVEHFLEHIRDDSKQADCSKCSLKFCADNYRDLGDKMKLHNEMHKSASKLKFERKSILELFQSNPNQRKIDSRSLLSTCTDCGYLIKSVDSHYRKREACENPGCSFETRCRIGFKQHTSICPLKEGASSRLPFGKAAFVGMNSLNKRCVRLKCSLCSFATRDSSSFAEHLLKSCVGGKLANARPQAVRKRLRPKDSEEFDIENKLFALHTSTKRLKAQVQVGYLDPEEQENWMSKVVPFMSDSNLSVFKNNSIVSIMDGTHTATNDFFSITSFVDESGKSNRQEEAEKLAFKLFQPSSRSQRKL